jgi:hypothetical protein
MGIKKKSTGYQHSPDEFKAYQWCINNGIYISPFCKENFTSWYIDIEINKKINRSPQVFNPRELWETIFKYYKYYYDKHKI